MTLLHESKGGCGSGRGHGCCFETLTSLTGRNQSHHETESSNLLSPKSFGLVITLALRHDLLALSWLHLSANHSAHAPLAPSLAYCRFYKTPSSIISTNRPTTVMYLYEPRSTLDLEYSNRRLYLECLQRVSKT